MSKLLIIIGLAASVYANPLGISSENSTSNYLLLQISFLIDSAAYNSMDKDIQNVLKLITESLDYVNMLYNQQEVSVKLLDMVTWTSEETIETTG